MNIFNIVIALIILLIPSALSAEKASTSGALQVPIDIPLNTWVERVLPAIGQAPVGDVKHARISHNSDNGRLYFQGGDHTGLQFANSGRNEIYSYSIKDNDWLLEHPYCPEDGEYQPAGPDQHGWVYDSTRKLFWMTPGYTTPGSLQYCNTDRMLLGTMMAFDPATKKWIYDTEWEQIRPTNRKFAQYDPVTDSIIRFAGSTVEIYDISNNQWTINGLAGLGSGARLGFDYTAMDIPARVIYMVSPTEGRLLRYDIDTQTVAYISDLPTGIIPLERNYLAWDSLNEVLLWIVSPNLGIEFYAYDPSINEWETLPNTHPDGLTVRGRGAVYDPYQNIFLIHGGTISPGITTQNPYIFLYRYGDGNQTPTPPSIISDPASLTVNEGEDATFSVVVSGSAPLEYQWYRNDNELIAGATGASHTIESVTAEDGARYYSTVTNSLGSDVSNDATLSVTPDVTAPSIIGASVPSSTLVEIQFSETISTTSAEAVANYQIDQGIEVFGATLNADNRTVHLQTDDLTTDIIYTVTINNIQDTSAAANEIVSDSSVEIIFAPVMNFDNGQLPLDWIPLTASRWEIVLDDGNNALLLNTTDYTSLPGDRLGEYIISPDSYEDFSMKVLAKTNETAGNSNADYALVFGFQDENNYYYMLFNRTQSNTQLFKVVGGVRQALASATNNWLTDDNYHEVEVRRTLDNIEVRFDNSLVLQVIDTTFLSGKLGLGSFNDSAYFDDIRIVAGAVTDLIFADTFE